MIKIFKVLEEKLKLIKDNKRKEIKTINNYETLKSIINLYNKYKEKSIKENRYYLKGSNFFKSYIDKGNLKELNTLISMFKSVDEDDTIIPLEIGNYIEKLTNDDEYYIGMHQSNSILSKNVYEDPILKEIIDKGLINNGSKMQGIITDISSPNMTIRAADDPLFASRCLISSFRGSKGNVIVKLPRKYITLDFDFKNKEYINEIYNIDKYGQCFIKPEFIVGYIANENNTLKLYTKEELLTHYETKKL